MTPDPALLERIAAAMNADLHPVRRMPHPWLLSAGLFGLFAATALSGAAVLGFTGFHRLSEEAVATIFPPLAALALLAAVAAASAITPGSNRPYHPAGLLAAACIVPAAVFSFQFRDYRTDSFVQQGIPCLRAGLLWATPAAVGAWLLLRRGFAVERGAAGIAVGTFAGLTGVTMLELHCPNLRMPHIVVWHLAVLPIAALAGRAIWSSLTSSARTAAMRS